MAHILGEANQALVGQARGYAEAMEKLKQEASAGREAIATHAVAKETAENDTTNNGSRLAIRSRQCTATVKLNMRK